MLVVQGGRDPFGTAAALSAELAAEPGALERIHVVEVPGADHGMRVAKGSELGAAGVRELVAGTVADFVRAVVQGVSTRP